MIIISSIISLFFLLLKNNTALFVVRKINVHRNRHRGLVLQNLTIIMAGKKSEGASFSPTKDI